MSVNKVILLGHVGKDPEIKHISDTKVANFSLATTETYTSKSGEKVSQTEWHNIVVWRGLAEIAEKYIAKGSQLYIEGKIFTRSWDDKDGNKRYRTEIQADTIQMLGKKPEGSQQQSAQPQAPANDFGIGMNSASSTVQQPGEFDPKEDDLPF